MGGDFTRIVPPIILVLLVAVTLASGQQPAQRGNSRAELLAQLHSEDAAVRSQVFEQLRSDPAALREPSVKAALVSLLDRENLETVSGEEEDYSMYVGTLADTVAKIVDWGDPHQVCILAHSLDLPDELADHAKTSVPCLLQRLKNAPSSFRGPVIAMLVQALSKGKSELDPVTVQTLRQAILKGLCDADADVKIPTVKALERFGGEDMVPALRVVAETDPSEHYAIRRWAAEAITAIQKREGQN